jgi:hypothetical protein
LQGVGVVFDDQNAQTFTGTIRIFRSILAHLAVPRGTPYTGNVAPSNFFQKSIVRL